MPEIQGLPIVLPFIISIVALISLGVKEYKRMATEDQERQGLDPELRDRNFGLSRAELERVSRQVFRSDRTRAQMKELATKKRGGYQCRYKVEG